VMGVDLAPIVHNSGRHGELQNLGLTPPNHGQTLGSKARAGANYRVTIRPGPPGAASQCKPFIGPVPDTAGVG
jgi:hypothetical protein